jgi:hypothetical protein
MYTSEEALHALDMKEIPLSGMEIYNDLLMKWRCVSTQLVMSLRVTFFRNFGLNNLYEICCHYVKQDVIPLLKVVMIIDAMYGALPQPVDIFNRYIAMPVSSFVGFD